MRRATVLAALLLAGCVTAAQKPPAANLADGQTGQPLTYHDPCWGRGVTVGYEPRACTDALASVKAFLTTTTAASR